MNISDTAVGLGRTFPVVDRVEEATKALVSTKCRFVNDVVHDS